MNVKLAVALGGDQCQTTATCRLNSLLQPQSEVQTWRRKLDG